MDEILRLISSMAPFLLLGFFLAGMMHAFIPNRLYKRFLSQNSFKSVVNAAILGIPLPLCSCGVIPTGMSLRKEGASKGSVVSFMIATPQTGVDSILATFSLMGLPFAVIRPLAALSTALLGGSLVNRFCRNDKEGFYDENCSACTVEEPMKHKSIWKRFLSGLHYAFVDMMQDIGRWLVLGLIVASLITVFVPDSFFELFKDNTFASYLIVLLCAIPMYLCSTGSIPIAVALMMKGLSPGTALVLLMAGPAVNVASIMVVGKVLGKKTMCVYLLSIIMGAIAFSLGIDYLLPREWFDSLVVSHACHHGAIPIFNWICVSVLGLLLLYALLKRYVIKKKDPTTTAPDELLVHVEGMSCNHCKASVDNAIRKLKGVKDVEVDLPTGRAVIHGKTTVEAVRKAVEGIGFKLKE